MAFAISRRVGNAVIRNRLRRRFREIVRNAVDGGAAAPGWYLVVVRPDARTASFAELEAAMGSAFSELGRRWQVDQ